MTTHENNTVSRPERKRRALPQKKSASNAATEPCPYDSSLLPRARLILELTNPRTGEVLSVEPISDDFSACESNAGGLMWKIAIARDNFAQTVYKGEDGEEVQMSPGGGTVCVWLEGTKATVPAKQIGLENRSAIERLQQIEDDRIDALEARTEDAV